MEYSLSSERQIQFANEKTRIAQTLARIGDFWGSKRSITRLPFKALNCGSIDAHFFCDNR